MHKLISFLISESNHLKKGGELELKPLQSAPRYYEFSLPKQYSIVEETKNILGKEVTFLVRAYPPQNILIEASIEVKDVFSKETFALRRALVDACLEISKKMGGHPMLSEEYSIAVVSGYTGDPEQFLDKKEEIAAFLKSEEDPLDEKEIEYTLGAQIKYGNNDLVIVDWDGAFVFDATGAIDDVVDLFQTANLQLLRYRALDSELDKKLKHVVRFTNVPHKKILFRKELSDAFKEIVRVRSQAIADFETTDKDIKLIGDWYSARLYELISKKFKLDEWRRTVREKLESLEDIYDIVSENFSISRNEFLELIQIVLFFVLQAGWFGLIILEFFYFTR